MINVLGLAFLPHPNVGSRLPARTPEISVSRVPCARELVPALVPSTSVNHTINT